MVAVITVVAVVVLMLWWNSTSAKHFHTQAPVRLLWNGVFVLLCLPVLVVVLTAAAAVVVVVVVSFSVPLVFTF